MYEQYCRWGCFQINTTIEIGVFLFHKITLLKDAVFIKLLTKNNAFSEQYIVAGTVSEEYF